MEQATKTIVDALKAYRMQILGETHTVFSQCTVIAQSSHLTDHEKVRKIEDLLSTCTMSKIPKAPPLPKLVNEQVCCVNTTCDPCVMDNCVPEACATQCCDDISGNTTEMKQTLASNPLESSEGVRALLKRRKLCETTDIA